MPETAERLPDEDRRVLLDAIYAAMMHGQMDPATKDRLRVAVKKIEGTDKRLYVETATMG